MMTFEEILPKIKRGNKAVRQTWQAGEQFIKLVNPQEFEGQPLTPYLLIMVEGEGYSMFQPTVCDILAQDWVIVEG